MHSLFMGVYIRSRVVNCQGGSYLYNKVYRPRRTCGTGWEWLPNPDYDGPPEEPDEPEGGGSDEFGDFDDERAFERRFETAAHDSFLAEFWAERAGCG